MILNVEKFAEREQVYWNELEVMLGNLERRSAPLSVVQLKRLYYLYDRVSGGLVKLSTFSGEEKLRGYLESLVSRSYCYIHTEKRRFSFRSLKYAELTRALPVVFRRNIVAFYISFAVATGGAIFGGLAIALDTQAKAAIIPAQFSHLNQSPTKRVEAEEKAENSGRISNRHSTFAAQLMANNIKVSIGCLALGITFGIGSMLMIFYNGLLLGAICTEYCLAGQTVFMLGWLMPHGVIEIPAFILAGQAGVILGNCLLKPAGSRKNALQEKTYDLAVLICGIAVLLVWAGIVESFMSQYHEPIIPYWVKIASGAVEFIGLCWFMFFYGRRSPKTKVT
ncbi:MAG: stage II sporulation protein M [Victivallaceae bacterium]|nr:stage II sporulation protein M [Victivallaceae bacterium]